MTKLARILYIQLYFDIPWHGSQFKLKLSEKPKDFLWFLRGNEQKVIFEELWEKGKICSRIWINSGSGLNDFMPKEILNNFKH